VTNPFDWGYLTAPIREVPTFGPFSLAFFVLFIAVFLFALVTYLTAERRLRANPILLRAVRIGTQWMMWLTGVGLFFFAFRIMRVEVFTLYMRFWSYLFFAIFVASAAYFVYWFTNTYPARKAALDRESVRTRYQPSAVAPTRRVKRKARRGIR
jgi:hypothetical protein